MYLKDTQQQLAMLSTARVIERSYLHSNVLCSVEVLEAHMQLHLSSTKQKG